jgi:hypothetical protein
VHYARSVRARLLLSGAILLAACGAPSDPPAPVVERVVVSPDGRGFVLAESDVAFVPLGFNYDRDREGALLEEYWAERWPEVVSDFDEMQALGANVVRVHLQVAAFMDGPDAMNEASLDRLADLADVARARGMHLDVTGLAAYRASADPAWYVALPEAERWQAQARFWGAIAERFAGDPVMFAYDLMNEPVVPTVAATDWTPGEFGGLSYVQNLVLELGDRDPGDVARAWRAQMIAAIRAHDPDVLITVGQLPFTTQPGFTPAELATDLDHLSVHVYPESGAIEESLALVRTFAAAGVPVVVEETFPLHCSRTELEQFVLATHEDRSAAGWLGFYWGQTIDELSPPPDIPAAILLSWLELFVSLRDAILPE